MKDATNTVFAQRLTNARKMRGLSQRDLCERLEGRVSANAIAKYETGKMMPTSEVQAALAIALGVDIDYFHHPVTVSIPANAWKFRRRSSLGTKQIAAIQQSAIDQMERINDIEQVCQLHQPFKLNLGNTSVATYLEAEVQARHLRKDLGLGNAPIFTPIERLESLGVCIVEVEADEKFDGTSAMVDNTPLLVLNASYTPERKRFTLFHELAHLILIFPVGADEERLCNAFASEMLIPTSVLLNRLGNYRKSLTFEEMKGLQRDYGISIEALMYKAHQHGIIDDAYFKHFNVKLHKKTNQPYRDQVRESLWQPETSTYLQRLVLQAFSNELITRAKAASLLSVEVDSINPQLIFV
jgi:Zn-dependent peptidase ImmA (M78 family)/transcriptional regulator with XRE-family HTH domain